MSGCGLNVIPLYRPAYPHDFGVQYTGFRLILRPSPLVGLLYDIWKILTIMYDIVFVWQYLIIAHQNIRLVGAQWKGYSEMETVLNTLGCTRFGHSIYSISWWFPFEHRKGVRKLNTCAAVGLCRSLETVHVQSPAGHRDGNLSQSEHFLWIAADSSLNKQNGADRASFQKVNSTVFWYLLKIYAWETTHDSGRKQISTLLCIQSVGSGSSVSFIGV